MSTVPDPPADPGATSTAARALAPDLARGGMLLLIALANVHVYVYGSPLGVRGYPRELSSLDGVIAALQMMLVDGRAYPLFGLLFGYGIVQLARRRAEMGVPEAAIVRLVRRRGWWMLLIGFAHGVLLWPGDVVGAYGLLAVPLAGLLVTGTPTTLLFVAIMGTLLVTLLYSASGLAGPDEALLPSMAIADPVEALVSRAAEWSTLSLLGYSISVFGAVALGAWAAQQRILDEPERHRRLLVRAAATGLPLAVLCGAPLALMAAAGRDPGLPWLLLSGSLHAFGGYAGAVGYAALFGLLAIRLRRGARPGGRAAPSSGFSDRPGQSLPSEGDQTSGLLAGFSDQPGQPPRSEGDRTSGLPAGFTGALQACGQRSLSCYLAQSVAFVTLLPAWTLGLGENLPIWRASLIGLGTWAVILVVAAWSARAGYRGPAEVLLRRLTYGPRPAPQPT